MLNFIQKLILVILNVQDCIFKQASLKNIYQNTLGKKIFTSAATLSFNSESDKVKEKIENNLEQLIIKYKNSPEKLLALINKNGTNVYKINFAEKILKLISQEMGIIAPCSGIKALVINILTKNKIRFYSDAVFIINTQKIDKYWLIQQTYKWYAMNMNMAGFDTKSQDNFNKYITGVANINNLNIDEIIGLKEAVQRDIEAINFVVKIAKSTETSKKTAEKMVLNGATV